MSKPIELIYSQQASDFKPGAAYSNPRFFTTPRSDVSKVYLVGDWPRIRAAYEALNVPVEQMDPTAAQGGPSIEQRIAPPSLAPVVPIEERGGILIPEDWRELNYNRPKPGRDFTLRGIAAMLSETPVINRDQAVEVIEAELGRRRSEQEGSNGLTRREMDADLSAWGAEADSGLDIEELVALHAEAKAAKA